MARFKSLVYFGFRSLEHCAKTLSNHNLGSMAPWSHTTRNPRWEACPVYGDVYVSKLMIFVDKNSTKCCYEHIGDAYGYNTACTQTVARDNLAHGMAKRAVFAKEISKGTHNRTIE